MPGSPSFVRQAGDAEVDHDGAGFALAVGHGEVVAEAITQLRDQRQRVVVVDEAHGFARAQHADRAEDRGMAEAAGHAAGVEQVGVGLGLDIEGHGVWLVGKVFPTYAARARRPLTWIRGAASGQNLYARWIATMPLVRLRTSTLPKPARSIMSLSVCWSGCLRIDSARYW